VGGPLRGVTTSKTLIRWRCRVIGRPRSFKNEIFLIDSTRYLPLNKAPKATLDQLFVKAVPNGLSKREVSVRLL